jgi:Tfp pilus assembly protein PilV
MLEVAIALAILAFGLLATTAGQLSAIKLSRSSRLNSLALYLAEEQLEVFQSMSGADLAALTAAVGYPDDPLNPIDPHPGDDVEMAFERRWIIQPDTPEAGVITVTVEVDWVNALGNVRTARVQTLKADL